MRIWAILSLVAGGIALWLFARADGAPILAYDSYQYLDAARNFKAGECLCTHLAHFDEQVDYGRMPVPFTHFPPGYPLLTAEASHLGLTLESAGLWISVAAFFLSIWLMWDIGAALGARPWAIAALALLWITNAHTLNDATSLLTESAYTAAYLAVAALLIRDLKTAAARPALLLLMGALAGAAYDIRYAGLFAAPVVGLYLVWRAWRTPWARWWAAAGVAAMGLLMGAVMVRNIKYTGSWRGGFTTSVHRPIALVVKEGAKGFYHLIFGDAVAARLDPWTAIFAISFALCAALVFLAWRNGRLDRLPKFAAAAYFWAGSLAAASLAGVLLTMMVTIAAIPARYYRPTYPLLLALIAPLLSAAFHRREIIAALVAIGAIAAIQGRNLMAAPAEAPHALVQHALAEPIQGGENAGARNIGSWLSARVPPNGTIFATEGQAVEYALHRNVISMIPPDATVRRQDAEGLHDLMTRFHAPYLLVFPNAPVDAAPEQDELPFLRGLASGAPPPGWLHETVSAPDAAVFECASCSQ